MSTLATPTGSQVTVAGLQRNHPAATANHTRVTGFRALPPVQAPLPVGCIDPLPTFTPPTLPATTCGLFFPRT